MFFSGYTHQATLVLLVRLSVSIMTIVKLIQLGLWLYATSFFSSTNLTVFELWPGPITSPVYTCSLCVTFTMFCTSFLTTKTQHPLLCKQHVLPHKWCVVVWFLSFELVRSVCCTNELSVLSVWTFSLNFFGEQVWWIILPSLSQSWLNTQSFSRPTTTSSSPRNMRWVSQRVKGQSLFVFSLEEDHKSLFFSPGKWLFLLFFPPRLSTMLQLLVLDQLWNISCSQPLINSHIFAASTWQNKTIVIFNYMKFP